MDEAEFIEQQAEYAKSAMRDTLAAAKQDLIHAADPRAWAKAHPWKTVAAAAVAGFVAATTVGKPIRLPGGKPLPSFEGVRRFATKAIKRTKMIMAVAEPFLQGLMAAQMATGNGHSNGGNGHQASHGGPHGEPVTPSESPTRP